MIQRQRLRLAFALALGAFVAGWSVARTLYGDDRSANAARTRAEIERKSREIKKTVEEQQRKVRQRLNLPESASGGASLPSTKPVASSPPRADTSRKNSKLPDSRAGARTPPPGMTKNSVRYSPRRG